jgi:hypothetical protein
MKGFTVSGLDNCINVGNWVKALSKEVGPSAKAYDPWRTARLATASLPRTRSACDIFTIQFIRHFLRTEPNSSSHFLSPGVFLFVTEPPTSCHAPKRVRSLVLTFVPPDTLFPPNTLSK